MLVVRATKISIYRLHVGIERFKFCLLLPTLLSTVHWHFITKTVRFVSRYLLLLLSFTQYSPAYFVSIHESWANEEAFVIRAESISINIKSQFIDSAYWISADQRISSNLLNFTSKPLHWIEFTSNSRRRRRRKIKTRNPEELHFQQRKSVASLKLRHLFSPRCFVGGIITWKPQISEISSLDSSLRKSR